MGGIGIVCLQAMGPLTKADWPSIEQWTEGMRTDSAGAAHAE